MTSTSSLMFLSTPLSLGLSLLAVVVTAVLGVVAWRRSGYRRSIGLLELLRFAVVAAAAVLLNQPEWVQEFRPDERPTVAVLWDDSISMQTRDVNRPSSVGQLSTRGEAIAPLTKPDFWEKLDQDLNVVITPFSSAESNKASDLNAPLAAALEQNPNLLGVVMISDGDWNAGPPPVEAAARLRLRSTPVVAIPVGSPIPLPDIELVSLDAPTFGIAGKRVRIPFTIESSLPRDHLATVQLTVSSGETITKEVRIAAMGRSTDSIDWQPASTGDYTVTLAVPPVSEETLSDNNTRKAPIAVREEKLRVLVVESYPRWEYRYLRNALSRDPGIEVACLLFHPGLTKQGGGNTDYIKQFPEGLDELAKFDVVFLGDVGCETGQLTTEQCRLLKGLVEHQASGLVVMPGWQGRQLSLLDTELADLYPVTLDPSQPDGWGTERAEHFQLTALGRRSLLTKLADTLDENAEIWNELPGFQWHAPVVRAKAGSEVLCVHESSANQYGRLPLLVTRTFGAGKVLFMGTDGAWRWRKGVEDKYHYRFWGQVVRWMAYQRNMAKGETMRLYYSPDQPEVRQTMTLSANVMERSGEPLSGGEVAARIVAPSGAVETVRLRSVGDEWGAYSGQYAAAEPGKHQVTLSAQPTGESLEASFYVQGDAAEKVGRPARIEVLDEIARVTRGRTIAIDRAQEAITHLASLPDPPPAIRRLQLWSHPIVAGTLICLLGVFWVLRKTVGLI
ncbi:hypothetical protein Pla175_32250 [Pirellulimonas nuda]|uniref:Glutamine amidotransferase domain-containing protein n=1 Tax=Pirellulimonas nuda TaxID=2528009 RepID=A0A518DEC7_9BACT|nr:hypothetical protein [Pirellulimonas nuda]QDU89829.1 hypothetical protein Pla175_32250 [Pirellulimonas nuda]